MTIILSDLPDHLQRFIDAKVASGIARSAEEYVLGVLQREAGMPAQASATPNGSEVSEEEMRRRVQQFHEELHRAGLLREVKPLPARAEKESFKPVEIKGPPLSQTVIEDRR
jgi:hypothetical protein